MMVPILDEIIHDAAEGGVQHVMIAMAHRGRLNVLAHILQKPYSQILAEFKDPILANRLRVDLGWMGDVKYHAGARIEAQPDGLPKQVIISMPPNPSHLEAVDPVLNGMARAAETSADQPGAPIVDKGKVLAILIHGDAAFPGQGIVAETLNLSRLDGYDVGGIIHIIANNQLGLHHRSRRVVQHQLRQRAGARLQDPDHPRQRRRSGRLHRSGAAGDRVSPAVQARLPDRSRRLSQVRPQRRRRAGVHAAADLSDRRRASDRAREIREDADRNAARSRRSRPTRWSRRGWTSSSSAYAVGEAGTGLRPAGSRSAAERRRQEGAHRGAARHAAGDQRRPDDGARGLHRASQARTRPRAPQGDVRVAGRAHRSTGPPPKNWRWRPSSPTACRSASPAKTSSAAPSATATPCYHDAVTRRRAHPAAGAAAGEGVVRDSQQPAVRVRVRRLRARLQPAGAGPPGAVGSAVRRLHQRRADHPRRVPDVGPRQVGHGAVAGAAAAPRLRRPGARSFERPPRAVPQRGRRHQHAHRQLHDGGAVFPSAAAAGVAAEDRSAAAGGDDAEEPAAPSVHGLGAGGARRGLVPAGDRRCRGGGAGRRRCAGSRCAAARSRSIC